MTNESKKPTTLNDIINPKRNSSVYDSLNTEERLKYLTIYVRQNEQLSPPQHEAVIEMTDKEFLSEH